MKDKNGIEIAVGDIVAVDGYENLGECIVVCVNNTTNLVIANEQSDLARRVARNSPNMTVLKKASYAPIDPWQLNDIVAISDPDSYWIRIQLSSRCWKRCDSAASFLYDNELCGLKPKLLIRDGKPILHMS